MWTLAAQMNGSYGDEVRCDKAGDRGLACATAGLPSTTASAQQQLQRCIESAQTVSQTPWPELLDVGVFDDDPAAAAINPLTGGANAMADGSQLGTDRRARKHQPPKQ
jgi:hypothetical protein